MDLVGGESDEVRPILKFDPAELTVKAGADVRVTFENRASVPHNLTFQAPINVATSTVVAPGTSETVQFKAPAAGEYPFVCTLHPGMGGKLISVTEDVISSGMCVIQSRKKRRASPASSIGYISSPP